MFINLHTIYTFAGANPNRDDTGAPKSLVYGGVERTAMSSQSMTRAKRRAYEGDPEGEKSFRSKDFSDWVVSLASDMVTNSGGTLTDEDLEVMRKDARKAVKALTADPKKDAKKDTLVWLAESEIVGLATKIAGKHTGKDASDSEDFLTGQKTASLAIAAFGRMLAQRPDLQTEAAVQRSVAFTTHEAVIDIDYFTAVDDLKTHGAGHLDSKMNNGAGHLDSKMNNGAGHLDSKMNTGGVYFWHCSIDTGQLLNTWTPAPGEDQRARLISLIRALLLALPQGGQATHAHHGLPAFVLAVPAHRPISLQPAFETPVTADRDGGYLQPSIDKMLSEHAATVGFLPGAFTGDAVYAGTVTPTGTTPARDLATLDAVAEHCADLILANQ